MSAGGDVGRVAALVREAVELKPDAIVGTGLSLPELKAATSTIPIMVMMSDPVGSGLVSSLARPGGNLTGVSVDAGPEVSAKYIELIRAIKPTIKRVGYLAPERRWMGTEARAVIEAAALLGMTILGPPVSSPTNGPRNTQGIW